MSFEIQKTEAAGGRGMIICTIKSYFSTESESVFLLFSCQTLYSTLSSAKAGDLLQLQNTDTKKNKDTYFQRQQFDNPTTRETPPRHTGNAQARQGLCGFWQDPNILHRLMLNTLALAAVLQLTRELVKKIKYKKKKNFFYKKGGCSMKCFNFA